MYKNTTGKAIYLTADKSKQVAEDDPTAAFLLVGPNGELGDKDAIRYGLMDAPAGQDPAERVKTLQAAHDAALARGATEEARVHRANIQAAEAEGAAARPASGGSAARAPSDDARARPTAEPTPTGGRKD